jgi:hypothetical protein
MQYKAIDISVSTQTENKYHEANKDKFTAVI